MKLIQSSWSVFVYARGDMAPKSEELRMEIRHQEGRKTNNEQPVIVEGDLTIRFAKHESIAK